MVPSKLPDPAWHSQPPTAGLEGPRPRSHGPAPLLGINKPPTHTLCKLAPELLSQEGGEPAATRRQWVRPSAPRVKAVARQARVASLAGGHTGPQ